MAHFAKIVDDKVVEVLVADDDMSGWLAESFGGLWVQTSYNTHGGIHYTDGKPSKDQSKGLRKNFAGIGFTYDEARDAFIPPKPYESWTLDEATCLWTAPIEYPADGGVYTWDESLADWVEVVSETT